LHGLGSYKKKGVLYFQAAKNEQYFSCKNVEEAANGIHVARLTLYHIWPVRDLNSKLQGKEANSVYVIATV